MRTAQEEAHKWGGSLAVPAFALAAVCIDRAHPPSTSVTAPIRSSEIRAACKDGRREACRPGGAHVFDTTCQQGVSACGSGRCCINCIKGTCAFTAYQCPMCRPIMIAMVSGAQVRASSLDPNLQQPTLVWVGCPMGARIRTNGQRFLSGWHGSEVCRSGVVQSPCVNWPRRVPFFAKILETWEARVVSVPGRAERCHAVFPTLGSLGQAFWQLATCLPVPTPTSCLSCWNLSALGPYGAQAAATCAASGPLVSAGGWLLRRASNGILASDAAHCSGQGPRRGVRSLYELWDLGRLHGKACRAGTRGRALGGVAARCGTCVADTVLCQCFTWCPWWSAHPSALFSRRP